MTHLDCCDCKRLQQLPQLAHAAFIELDCSGCLYFLKDLPDMPDSLERLQAASTKVSKLPKLPSETFKHLDIRETAITDIRELPEYLPGLEDLRCGGPIHIPHLPALPNCKTLFFFMWRMQQLPEQLPAGLLILDCYGCYHLQQLPAHLPPTLRELDVSWCSNLHQLPEQLSHSAILAL